MNFTDILVYISISQLLLLIVALVQHLDKRKSNLFFALFFFAQLITYSAYFLNRNPDFVNKVPYLFHLTDPFWFVWAPTIYLAIRFESFAISKFTWKQMLHYIPAALFTLYLIFAFYSQSFETKKQIIRSFSLFTDSWLVRFFIEVQVFIYNILAITSLELYATKINISSKKKKARLKWNRFILYGYFITCIFSALSDILAFHGLHYKLYDIMQTTVWTLYFTAILYRVVFSSHFSTPIEKERFLLVENNQVEVLKNRLEHLMKEQKIYLEFEVNVNTIADKLQIKEKQLSEIINQYYKMNFKEFLNKYRIDEAKRLLIESKTNGQTILEIIYASGFSSKSSFNQVFKNATGITPSQFKKGN